ncbi:MAG: ribonuclease HII [Kiritimatiellia bacterium]
MNDLLKFERDYWSRGFTRIAGVDEAGRGPLAGPVVAAAVILNSDLAESQWVGDLSGVTDSKKLSAARRDHFFQVLIRDKSIAIGVGSAAVEEIDSINILRASDLAMCRAVNNLPESPDCVFVDGSSAADLKCTALPIVGGDSKSLSVAAASIVAKVVRDRYMIEVDGTYPEYGFARHKGYGSKAHVQALLEHGPVDIHRRTFRPVMEASEIRRRSDAENAMAEEIPDLSRAANEQGHA